MDKVTFDDLWASKQTPIEIANRMTRKEKVRRKPRDPEESVLLGGIIAKRVNDAERAGELTLDGGRIRFKFTGVN